MTRVMMMMRRRRFSADRLEKAQPGWICHSLKDMRGGGESWISWFWNTTQTTNYLVVFGLVDNFDHFGIFVAE